MTLEEDVERCLQHGMFGFRHRPASAFEKIHLLVGVGAEVARDLPAA